MEEYKDKGFEYGKPIDYLEFRNGCNHKEFEKEIESVQEQLGDIENAESTVASQADAHGRFVYRTAALLLRTLKDAYTREAEQMKKSQPN